jgi:hypothetical protein
MAMSMISNLAESTDRLASGILLPSSKQLESRNAGYTADDPVPGRTDPGGTDGSLKVGLSEEEVIFAFDRFSDAQEFGCSVQWVECIER